MSRKRYVVAVVLGLALATTGRAQLVWNGNAASGAWDTTTLNWLNSGVPSAYTDGSGVLFGDGSTQGLVGVSSSVAPGSIVVSNSATSYQIQGGAITGTGWLRKDGGGTLVLGSANSFSGGLTLNAGTATNGAPRLISRAQGALGAGTIQINRSSANGTAPTLQFDGVPQVVANPLAISGTQGGARIVASNLVNFTGTLNLGSTGSANPLYFGGVSPIELHPANSLAGQTNCWILGLADGLNPALYPALGTTLPAEIGVKLNGGILILGPQLTWGQFAALHSFNTNAGATPAAGQWSMNFNNDPGYNGGFAAKDSAQVIDGTAGGFASAINVAKLMLGSAITNADGSFYANAPVEIAANLVLGTNNVQGTDRQIMVAVNGPAFGPRTAAHVVQKISGNISGPSALRFAGRGTSSDSAAAEIVLSGANSWNGGLVLDLGSTSRVLTGPGSLGIVRSGVIVRFSGNGSLPSGNGGNTSYLASLAQNGDTYRQGFMLTGVTNGNSVYQLNAGYKFVLGNNNLAIFGSTEGNATLQGSELSVWGDTTSRATSLNLLARDGSLTLGSSGSPVKFTASTVGYTNLVAGWTLLPTAPLLDRTNTTTLIKRGAGTLVLANVQYRKVDGATDNTGNFTWQVGGGTVGLNDGVIRETGTTFANSLRSQSILLNGGVLGLAADYAPVLGSNSLSMAGVAGGGFAAYGGTRTVALTPRSGNTLNWSQPSPTANDFFMNPAAPLILNAADADSMVVLASAPTNCILLGSGNRVIQVNDNPAVSTDGAVIALRISNTATNCSLVKAGPGLLVLTATNNDWGGSTWVSNGTLVVNGTIASNSSSVYVCSGATLGGTGTIGRAVSVAAGGTLAPGVAAGQGALVINGSLSMNGGSYLVGVSSAGDASVVVNGNVTLGGALIVSSPGYWLPGDTTLPLLTVNGTVSGQFTSVTPGYQVTQQGNQLVLSRRLQGLRYNLK